MQVAVALLVETPMANSHQSWPSVLAWALGTTFAALTAAACVYTWVYQSDGDLLERRVEYAWFREGTYPHAQVEPQVGDRPVRYTVYPPHVFPMFAVFFEPGGMVQGRLLLQVASLISLFVIGRHGYRALEPIAPQVAPLGAVLGLAVAGNLSAIKTGQLAILCMGLIVQQMNFLARDRPLPAALCWTLAMIKPHVALPFAALFLLRRRSWALGVGLAALTALAAFACFWTGVSPEALVIHWTQGISLKFSEEGFAFSPGPIAKVLGVDHRVMLATIAACVTAIAAALIIVMRRMPEPPMLPLAAACAVLGMFMCYHRHYDNVMLFPAVLFAVAVAAQTRRWRDAALAAVFMLTLVVPVPIRFLHAVPALQLLVGSVWICGVAVPLVAWAGAKARHRGLA